MPYAQPSVSLQSNISQHSSLLCWRVHKEFVAMSMKQDLRVAVTKRMIHDAPLRLPEKKPVSRVRVNELCEKSGINRTSFYRGYLNPYPDCG